MRAWTWIPADRRLPHGDGRRIITGRTLTVEPPLGLCRRGLHASVRVLDALQYAESGLVARVECSGVVVLGEDKLCCERRKTLWVLDATRVLHEFACRVAEKALRAAKVTDERCWTAIRVKRAWHAGKATDAELAAARGAAWAAASDAAWGAAWAAAWAAAWGAARGAAWAAASDAASAAAWAAARDAQNRMLTRMLLAEHRGAHRG